MTVFRKSQFLDQKVAKSDVRENVKNSSGRRGSCGHFGTDFDEIQAFLGMLEQFG